MYMDEASQIDKLQFSFGEIRDAGWNPDGDLLWGYFFVDTDVEKLERLRPHLESLGYRFVDIFELEEEEGEEPSGEYMLHVEKVETHSPVTLARRNVELARLASKSGVKAYDGWDVGQVE